MSFNPPPTHRNTYDYDEHDPYYEFQKGNLNSISSIVTPRGSYYHTPSSQRRPTSRQSMASELMPNNFQTFSRMSMMSPFFEPRESIVPVEDIKSSNRWLLEVPMERIKTNVTQFVSNFESCIRNDIQNTFENIKGYQEKLVSNINFTQNAQNELIKFKDETRSLKETLELETEIENTENEGIVKLQKTLSNLLERENDLKQEVQELKEKLKKKNEEKKEKLEQISAQLDSARSEIEFLEPTLNMEIKKISDISSREYNLIETDPPIPEQALLLKELNESRNFYYFLKSIRRCLKMAINS